MTAAGALRMADRAESRAAPARLGAQMADIHLARFLLRPVDFVDAAHWQALVLSPAVVSHMNAAGPFRRAVNAALSDIVIGPVEVDASGLAALDSTREGRLSAFLLVAPMEAVERVASFLAAAVLSRRITQLLFAADRRQAREEMGDEAFDFAVAEAPLMCPDLAGLAAGLPERAEVGFSTLARMVLISVIGHIAPALERLFRLRFPPFEPMQGPLHLSPAHLSQAVRLMLRKEPSWSASID